MVSSFKHYVIPDVAIAQGHEKALQQTPGYYSDDTFFYNKGDGGYCKRQYAWLFIHEAIPGHHLQLSFAGQHAANELQRLFHYGGYAEGWAAYTEEFGDSLMVYKSIYDELGRWEWDLVRSVRVPIDIGLNYLGWSHEKAMAFWKANVVNQDAIAEREIQRVQRWPCQAITYKYGAAKFLTWREKYKLKKGNQFDLKSFHDILLKSYSLPFPLIERRLFG